VVRYPSKVASLVHSRTCGDRVREGARKGEERSPRRGSAVAGPDRGLVEVLQTGTVVGPSRRDVGRTKQRDCGNTFASNQPRLLPFKTNHFDLSNPQPPSFFFTQRPLTSHSTLFPHIQLNFPSHPTPL